METAARYTGTWYIEARVEPGSVPDRAAPYSLAGAMYRPGRLDMTFTASARSTDPRALQMENGSGFMRAARDGVHLSKLVISGARVKKDGTPGVQGVREEFWDLPKAPDWAVEAAATILEDLKGTS